jgi:hypothetical protein
VSKLPLGDELSRVLAALRTEQFEAWKPWVATVDMAVIDHIGIPDDVWSWSLIVDVLDVIPGPPSYRVDLVAQFEQFAEEFIGQAKSMLEDESDGLDIESSIDELNELERIAELLGTETQTIGFLTQEYVDFQSQQRDKEAVRRPLEVSSSQLDHSQSREPPADGSIFEYL